MATHRWSDIKKGAMTPERIEKVRNEARAEALSISLRELRETVGATQEELAKTAEIAQSELSRIERREDHRLSTIRRYVEALGGELEVAVIVKGKRFILSGI